MKKYLQQINNRRCHVGIGIVCLYLVLMPAFGYAERYPYPTLLIGVALWLIFVNAPRHRRRRANLPDGVVVRHEILALPSSALVLSTFWEKNASDIVLSAPARLTGDIEVLTKDGVRTVKSVRFAGDWEGPRREKQTIRFAVDGGFLFLGDPAFTDHLRRAGRVEPEVLRICEPDAPLPYALFHDPDGTKALVLLTGEGDDWYTMEIEISGDGKCVLSVDFFYYEKEAAPA